MVETKQTAATQGELRLLTYNVAGLPVVSKSNPRKNSILMGRPMSEYDLAAVQEDFSFHRKLTQHLTLPYATPSARGMPFGDGMNFFSRFPLRDIGRVRWEEAFGRILHGADAMAPKGILYATMTLCHGAEVDLYNFHADACNDPGSVRARNSNCAQLARLIERRSAGRPVIVMGDTNSLYVHAFDRIQALLVEPCGLTDCFVACRRGGRYPPVHPGFAGVYGTPEGERLDKIFFRSGAGVSFRAVSCRVDPPGFYDPHSGKMLSDHMPVCAVLAYEIA